MSNSVVGVLKILAIASLEGSTDLGLIVGGHLLLEDLETLVDKCLDGLLRAGEDPDVLGLSEKVAIARVNDGDVLVVGVENSVVAGGGEGEELDLALGTVEGGNGSC